MGTVKSTLILFIKISFPELLCYEGSLLYIKFDFNFFYCTYYTRPFYARKYDFEYETLPRWETSAATTATLSTLSRVARYSAAGCPWSSKTGGSKLLGAWHQSQGCLLVRNHERGAPAAHGNGGVGRDKNSISLAQQHKAHDRASHDLYAILIMVTRNQLL